MALDTSELLKLVKRYDDWNLSSKVSDLGGEQPEGYVGRLLWTARKAGDTNMANANHLLYLYPGAPELWDADDFIKLVNELQTYFPDGENDKGSSGWCQTLPGSASGIRDMIRDKQGDEAFGKAMSERLDELPPYWGTGVSVFLAMYKLIPYTKLSDDVQKVTAKSFLRSSEGRWDDESYALAFPEDIWHKLLLDVLLSEEEFILESPDFELLLAVTTPEQLLPILLKRLRNYDANHTTLEALDKLGDGALELLEQTLSELQVQPKPVDEYPEVKGWGYAVLVFSYLRHCKRAGHTPPTTLDPTLGDFFEHYEIGWSGSSLEAYQEMMVDALSIIPPERLEPILLRHPTFPWMWVAACQTPTMLQTIVETIINLPKSLDYNQEELLKNLPGERWCDFPKGLLSPMRKALYPLFIEALKATKKPPPQRKLIFTFLAKSDDPVVVEGLLLGLDDGSKGVREIAMENLVKFGAGASIDTLEVLLGSKRKDGRIIAAELMGLLPPDERLYKLAQARLKKEKTGAVKELLEDIKEPGDAPVAVTGHDETIAALVASEGKNWKEYVDIGAVLVDVYWQAWAQTLKAKEAPELNTYAEFYEPWIELLTHFKDEDAILPKAVDIVTCFVYYYATDYLDALDQLFPQLNDQLFPLVKAGKLFQPKELGGGKSKSFEIVHLLNWMAGKDIGRYGGSLLTTLKETKVSLRKVGYNALASGGMDAFPVLREALTNDAPKIRQAAAELLGKLSSTEVLGVLESALGSETNSKVKSELEKSIATMRSETLDVTQYPHTAAGEADLDAVLAALPRTGTPGDLDELPTLCWAHGEPLSEGAMAWFVSTLGEESMEVQSATLLAVRTHLDDASCYALAEKKIEGQDDRWHGRYYGNSLFVQGILGKPEHIAGIAGKLEELASSRSTYWGSEGVAALVRNGSDAAIRFLEHASKKSRRNALKGRAHGGLNQLASMRGMSLEDLLDSAVSDFGFDASGVLKLDYGPREITIQLGPNNEFLITDDKGKSLKTLPKARQSDDAEKVAAERKEVALIKKQIKQIHKAQLRRMEDALSGGRTWPIQDWEKRFRHHPLMHAFSRQLIWEALLPESDTGTAFLVTEEGELVDVELEEFTLPAAGDIRVLHPLHLKAEEREAWQEIIADQGLNQPFAQLDRRTFLAADVPKDKTLFIDLPMCTSGQFLSRLNQYGYEPGPREDAGMINQSYKTIGSYEVTLSHMGFSPEYHGTEANMEILGISVGFGEDSINWRELPPVVFSELVRDVHLLMSA